MALLNSNKRELDPFYLKEAIKIVAYTFIQFGLKLMLESNYTIMTNTTIYSI